MNVVITFTNIGIDAGPFYLYSDVDGFLSAFESGVTRTQLLAGFSSVNVPTGTSYIRAKSFGGCLNYVDLFVPAGTTSTTTSTTTVIPTTTTSTTAFPAFRAWHFSDGHPGTAAACADADFANVWFTNYQIGIYPAMGSILYHSSNLTGPVNGVDLWYNLGEAFADSPTLYKIGTDGSIDSFFNC